MSDDMLTMMLSKPSIDSFLGMGEITVAALRTHIHSFVKKDLTIRPRDVYVVHPIKGTTINTYLDALCESMNPIHDQSQLRQFMFEDGWMVVGMYDKHSDAISFEDESDENLWDSGLADSKVVPDVMYHRAFISFYGATARMFYENWDKSELMCTDTSYHHKVVSGKISVDYLLAGGKGGVTRRTNWSDATPWSSISRNYSEKVQAQVENALLLMKSKTNGLILLHGPVGTGKTHIVSAMLSESNKRRKGLVLAPSGHFLMDTGNLMESMEYSNGPVLIVLEDIGDILETTADRTRMDQRANLLNFSDGLLASLGNVVIVATFNSAIDTIDPAVLRPGRCLANIEVGNLSQKEAEKWMGKSMPAGEYSLAQLYEAFAAGTIPEPKNVKKSMGFPL